MRLFYIDHEMIEIAGPGEFLICENGTKSVLTNYLNYFYLN